MVLARTLSAGAALPSVATAAGASLTVAGQSAAPQRADDGRSRRASSSRAASTSAISGAPTDSRSQLDRRATSASVVAGSPQRLFSTASRRGFDSTPRLPLAPSLKTGARSFSSTSRRAASVRDPYATLGVKKDASAKEIKSAYYDLAKKYHPDTSKEKGAKERFVEIQSAYDILSDDKKKAAFDRYGTTDGQPGFNPFGGGGAGGGPGFDPFGGGGGFGGFGGFQGGARDASDIFEGLFGAAFGGRGRSSGAGFAGETRGEDIETSFNISFEEACRGTSKRVTVTPVERCSTCDGRGLKKNRHKRTCGVCNGTGTRTFVIQSGFQMASTCPACNGTGETVAPGDECQTCDGVGRVRTRRTVEVKVPPGVDDGAKIRMDGQGDVPLQGSGSPGSLYVRIGVRPSKIWRRQGSNLYYPATVPFHTAILGGRVRVPTLDGDVEVRVPTGTQVGDEMLLRGRGVSSLLKRGEKGDLLVQFEVQIPRSLTKRQREILQQYVDDIEGRAPPPQPSTPPPPPPPQPESKGTPEAEASEAHKGESKASAKPSPSASTSDASAKPSEAPRAAADPVEKDATQAKGESKAQAATADTGDGGMSSGRAEQDESSESEAQDPADDKQAPHDKGVLGKTWDWLRGR